MSSGKGLPAEGSSDFVSLDLASFRGEPSVGGEATRYSFDLLGRVDGRWLRSFRTLQQNVDVFEPYRLDSSSRSISFDVRAGEEGDRVIDLIERLVELVRSVEGAVPDD